MLKKIILISIISIYSLNAETIIKFKDMSIKVHKEDNFLSFDPAFFRKE